MKKSMFLHKGLKYMDELNKEIEKFEAEGWTVESYQTIAGAVSEQVYSNQQPTIVVYLTKQN